MVDVDGTPARHTAIQRLLPRLAGASDSQAVAAVACDLVQHLSDQAAPIIGTEGVRAVFGRAVHVVRRQVAWLPPAPATVTLPNLRTALEQQEVTLATDAAILLLTTLSDLLAALVGEPLTVELLVDAWPDAALGHNGPETQA